MFRGFPSCFSGFRISRSPTCFGLELFLGFLSFRLLGFPVLSSPCGVSRVTTWYLFQGFFWIGWFIFRPLRWCSAVSSCSSTFSGLADPFYFSSLSLSFWSVLGGVALRVFLLLAFGHLYASPFVLSPCPWSSLCFWWCVPAFSPQLVSGFSRVSACWCAPVFEGALPRVALVLCLRFVGSAPFLPSSPAPPVSYGLVVVLSPRWASPLWVYWLSHPTIVFCGFVIGCLSPI